MSASITEVNRDTLPSKKFRTCIHNLDSPSGRVFSRHAALNFLEINTMIPAKICLA